MYSLQGIFDTRPKCKRNFIQENVKLLRTMQRPLINKEMNPSLSRKQNKFQHVVAKVPVHVTPRSSSKQRDTSSQEVERASNYDAQSRRSILSSLPEVRNTDLRSIQTDQGSEVKSVLRKASQLYPVSADSHSNGHQSNEKARKQSKHNAVSSQNDAKPVIKTLSAMSLSRSPTESLNLESDTVHRPLLEKSALSSVLKKNVQSAQSERTQHRPFSEKSVQSVFSENNVIRAASENSVSLERVRSVGCQTVLPEDTESMFNDGVIKYPSFYSLETMRAEPSGWVTHIPTQDSSQQTDISPVRFPPIMPEPCKTHLNPIPSDDVIPYNSTAKNFHQIPEPLQEQLLQHLKGSSDNHRNQDSKTILQRANGLKINETREKVLKEVQKHTRNIDKSPLLSHEIFDASWGHVPLPESERVETLRKLQKSYEDLIRQLNALPVKTDTMKMRQRKIDIEKQLSKLEEGIKVFSRPKVYVKAEM